MNIQSNIIMMYCNVCGKPYKKLLRSKKGGRNTVARPYRSYTCSRICSRKLVSVKQGILIR